MPQYIYMLLPARSMLAGFILVVIILITSNIDYLIAKYDGKPESYYESFKKLIEVNQYIKTVMTLRREAAQYQRYLAYTESGSIYSPANIEQQLDYLKEEINSAIILLREEG